MDIRGYFENKKVSDVLSKNLTQREVEILALYSSGFTAKEISEILTLSENTVRTHINNIYSKIDISDDASPKITLCLFYNIFRQEIIKMGGFKKSKV